MPLRIGIHCGEAHETATRDLLGKGVNVAARLMTRAQPGVIVLSAAVKDAIPPDMASRLRGAGLVRLDKMSERIETFELASPWARPRAIPVRWAMAAAAVLVLVGGLWIGAQAVLRPKAQSIAVLEFRALDPALESFVTGLADRLIGTMSANDLQAAQTSASASEDRIAAALERGASFALDGSARTEGEDLLVTARLIDRRGNLALWSGEYRRAADEQDYLQQQIGADVTHVVRCALMSVGSEGIDPATLSVFLRACDRADELITAPEDLIGALRQVTARAPRFSRGWSALAIAAAQMSLMNLSPEERRSFRAEAEEAIARACRLDRRNGECYLAQAWLLDQTDWRGRQALIERALQVDPNLASAHVAKSQWCMEVGWVRDALAAARRAATLEPLNPDHWANLAPILSANGFQQDADELRRRLHRLWPQSGAAWLNRFHNATYRGDPDEALRMLDTIETAPMSMHPQSQSRWREFLLARRSGDALRLRRAALAMRDLIPGKDSRLAVMSALSIAGEIDAAIEVLHEARRVGYPATALAMPPWTNLRRDRRYMDLVKDTGLIQFWRESQRWPDHCLDPDLPYDCSTEAARALPP